MEQVSAKSCAGDLPASILPCGVADPAIKTPSIPTIQDADRRSLDTVTFLLAADARTNSTAEPRRCRKSGSPRPEPLACRAFATQATEGPHRIAVICGVWSNIRVPAVCQFGTGSALSRAVAGGLQMCRRHGAPCSQHARGRFVGGGRGSVASGHIEPTHSRRASSGYDRARRYFRLR